jgi:subtilase family serine protease
MRRILFICVVVLLFASTGAIGAAAPQDHVLPAHKDKAVCAKAQGPDTAGCDAKVVTNVDGVTPLATTSYLYGYGPADLASAYNLTSGATPWVAIVDAYDNPNAFNDLTAYRSQFGLPSCPLTTCFKKVNQSGNASPLPSGNTGWGQEIDLDIEMVSAVCPQCKILLVEASSNSFTDLGAAVNRAATMGAAAISNSYGTSGEFFGETSYDSYYNHPGIAVTVSSGDSGYGVEFPAASNHVVAVGGTSLVRDTSTRGWSESAWNGAGSGCRAFYSKPSWQSDPSCAARMEADVSAVADPNTGVAVYDSYGSSNGQNWYVFGGTSVASPIIASVFGLAGNAGSVNYAAQLLYTHAGSLFDVTSGSNGSCSGKRRHGGSGAAYFCTAGPGYDGPTGLGTPNGTGAF